MLWQEKKYTFAYLQKFKVRKDSLGLQIANPQITIQQITKQLVHKSQICAAFAEVLQIQPIISICKVATCGTYLQTAHLCKKLTNTFRQTSSCETVPLTV
jgi:hypothetical protein